MGKSKTTHTIELDADIKSLKGSLEEATRALGKLGGGEFSEGLQKRITSILGQLDKLQKKASQPLTSAASFRSLEKGFGDIVVDAKNLLEKLDQIKTLTSREKLSLLPEDQAKKFKEALSAISAYEKAIERLEKKRIRTVEGLSSQKTGLEEKVATARDEASTKRTKYTEATKAGTKYGDAKAILAQAEAAKKAQKEMHQLQKQLEAYRRELEELKKLEKRSPGQDQRIEVLHQNISSVSGKIGAKKKFIQSGPTEMQITQATQVVEAQGPEIQDLEEQAEKAEKELRALEEALEKLNKRIKSNSEIVSISQADYKEMYERAKKLGVSLEGVTESASPESVQILTQRLTELVEKGLKPVETVATEASPHLKQVGVVAEATGDKVREAADEFEALSNNDARIDNLKQTISQFIGWTGASKALSAALRNAFQDIKELDAAMTEIAVVTDFDISDMWQQLPDYTKRANELGMSITSVYEASALFYQQGLNTNEMVELSNETLKMARIAGLDAADATDRMTAALRGFNMELDEASAQKIADVYSQLAAITAADVDEISSAMTKTASIASSAGMEFETTAAFLSQIIETTRESAETAGTAMKTVIARFQELKKSPDEIGEIDGEIVDANAIETALRSVGVSLRDSSGQFRELDDVFMELSSKWNTLDKNTQRYIATIAAGSRQQSRFIAMMQDYSRTQELITAANNSAGASQKQYEKTLDSIKTKLEELDNAWTVFSTGLMNSDFVKGAVDFLTSILNTLNKVTEGFGSFTGSLSKVGTLVAIFQTAKAIVTKFFDEIVQKIYSSSVQAGRGMKDGVKMGLGEAIGNITGVSKMALGARTMREAKGLRVDDEGAAQWAAAQEARYKKLDDLAQQGRKSSEEYLNIEKEIKAAEEDRIYTQKEANLKAKEGFDTMCEGAQTAAMALTMVGTGIGMIGNLFAEAGFSEVGNVFQEISKWVTLAGSSLTAIIPMVKLLGSTFKVEGGKIVASGVAAQMAWWWVLLIVAAVATLAIGFVAAAKAAKKNSADKKFEDMANAANEAADAADRMAESYENLKNSLDGIGEVQTELDGLVQGTDAWRGAVERLNGEVLELIEEYPELAKFVQNKDGILNIDLNDAGVQKALEQAKQNAVSAQIVATNAQLNTLQARDQVNYEGLDDNAKFDYQDPEKAAQNAYAAAFGGAVAAGGTAGAVTGTAVGGWAAGLGTVIGGLIGVIGGAIGGSFAGDAAAEVAAENARSHNAKTQTKTEQLAMALANGDLIDTGSGYKLKDDVSQEEFEKRYHTLDTDAFTELYSQVGESTDVLKEFGLQLIETKKQSQGYYDSIATQIQLNTDTSQWDQTSKKIFSNIFDGERMAVATEEALKELTDVDMLDKKLDEEMKTRRTNAIQKAYGEGSRLKKNEKGGYDIIDAKGQIARGNVTSDDLKNIVASTEAETEVAGYAKNMPEITNAIIKGLGEGNQGIEAALVTALQDESGEKLTWKQLEFLNEITDEEIEAAYENSQVLQEAFGSLENFKDNITLPQANAIESFGKTETFFKDKGLNVSGLSSGALMGLAEDNRVKSVYQRGTEDEVAAFEDSFNKLMQYDNAEDIAAYMNTVDWGNIESLNRMRYVLEEQFGVVEDDAINMASAIEQATGAMSSSGALIDTFGGFYQATQRINRAIKEFNDLSWEYERAMKNGADATELAKNLEEQRIQLLAKGNAALSAYEQARADQSTKYAEGVSLIQGVDLTKYTSFDEKTGTYDAKAFNDRIKSLNEEERKRAEQWFNEVVEANKLAEEQNDIAKDAYEQLEELNEAAEEAYYSLYEQVGELITSELQKQIEVEKEILDATETANEKLIDKIQQQIDEDRQSRENEKTEKEISDLYARAAYLGADTSGASQMELLELQKQIAEEEQNYQDTLIDQSLQQLQDANDKAAEQRERQISLQEQQLEAYKNSEEYQSDITKRLKAYYDKFEEALKEDKEFDPKETELGAALISAGILKGMNNLEQEKYWAEITKNTAESAEYANGKLDPNTATATLLSGIQENTSIQNLADVLWADRLAQANEQSVKFSKLVTGDKEGTYFNPGKIAASVRDYETESDPTGAYGAAAVVNRANSAFEESNATYLRNSDIQAEDTYADVNARKEAIESLGGRESELLSRSDFYSTINNGGTVTGAKGKEYSQQVLIEGLYNGMNEDELFDGSYEQYLKEYMNSDIYRENSSESALKQYRSQLIGKLREQLAEKIPGGKLQYGSTAKGVLSDAFSKLVDQYKALGGNGAEELMVEAAENFEITQGFFEGVRASRNGKQVVVTGLGNDNLTKGQYETISGGTDTAKLDSQVPDDFPDYNLILLDGKLYFRNAELIKEGNKWVSVSEWYRILDPIEDQGGGAKNIYSMYKKKLLGFKTGGLADFTGPAWLDGTPSRPEYILNAKQTERFFSLVDVLESVERTNDGENHSGDNYFEIAINVERLESDYDVEKVADKIRRMIAEDATYRNVNTINHIR